MNVSKGALLLVVSTLAVLSLVLVLPYMQYLLLAILLAYIIYPAQARLAPRFGPNISAGLLVVAATLAVVIPFLVSVAVVAGDAVSLFRAAAQGKINLTPLVSRLQRYSGGTDVVQMIRTGAKRIGEAVLGYLPELLGSAMHMLIGLGMTLFLLFFFLRDAPSFFRWFRDVLPLPDEVQDALYGHLDNITRAVLMGHILVAIIQGVLAGLGLFATGIPNATFWTFVMILLSLIPLVGAPLVWGPACLYLVSMGRTTAAIALFAYSAVVVGLSDEYLRPVLVDRYANVNPSVIVVGVVGGISAFGFMGLFFGPVIVGALKAALEVFDDYYREL